MASPVKEAKAKHIAAGFTEIAERGKGYLKSKKPGVEQYALTTQVGGIGWHFGDGPFTESHEVDTAWVQDLVSRPPWRYKMVLADYNAYAFREATLGFDQGQLIEYVHPGSGEAINFQPTQLQWSNDLGQIEPIADPQAVSATVVDDTLLWTGAYGTGLDFRWQTQGGRLFKALDIASLSDLGAPPQFIIDGGNPYLRLELLFQKSAAVDILVDGVLWDEKANNPKTTATHIEFRLASTQETLWYFRQPLAWDQNETIHPLMHVRKSAITLFVQIRIPWLWLESAIYPVVADATIDVQVGAGADDGQISHNSSNFDAAASNAYVGQAFSGWDEDTWGRWAGISGLSGATITTSYMYVTFPGETGSADMNINAEDATAPAAPTSYANYNSKLSNLTSATVNMTAWVSTNRTPSLNAIIQELADSYDPSAIQLILQNNSSPSGSYFKITQYESSPSWAPELYIEYTTGAADINISVSDGLTVADSPTITPLILAGVSISDGITIVDSPTVTRQQATTLSISVSDGATVADSPTVRMTRTINRSDGVTVNDSPAVSLQQAITLTISVNDGITVADTATIIPLILGDVSVSDSMIIGETTTADIQLNITESDGVTVTDAGSIAITSIADLSVNVSDGVTVADTTSITPLILGDVSISDGITVGESVTGDILLEIAETDGVTVADVGSIAITSIVDLTVSVTDGITVADSTTITPLILGDISVSDDVTVGETVTGDIQLDIGMTDGVTVADAASIAIVAISDLSVSISDSLTVTDTANLDPLLLADVSVSDGISVGEAATTDLLIEVTESDSLTIADSISLSPVVIDLLVTDNVTVADVDTVVLPGYIITGNPDNVAYVVFRDKRAFIEYRDKRAIV